MITAVSKDKDYVTELSDGSHIIYSDTIKSDGGTGEHQTPADLVLSAYTACINITIRKRLKKEGFICDKVTVMADMDRKDPEDIKIYTKIIIDGDIPPEKKDEIIENVKDCPICKVLRGGKSFLPLEI